MRHVPNILSLLRIVMATLLLIAFQYPVIFSFMFIIIGLTDIFDGYLARRLNCESNYGARLDSIGDFIFFMVVCFFAIYTDLISTWLYYFIVMLVIIRLINLVVTRIKYKQFIFVHTFLNKLSGAFFYLAFLALYILDSEWIAWLACLIAFLSAIEELMITIAHSDINLNRKGLIQDVMNNRKKDGRVNK
ncbi:CDP-alcohol phosphatidyltransferase family protein [Amphibacillus cookii]|uniref:CDP-alcohol phosphatidyltransferase family protein n=1 Tax=Amphibacillus cookii TaxID=767787 RepID=UPI00195B9496|nr:CDP-alcohol phosphatidyltransferase family protein [Amphibacillus cookii]MBM7541038.1 CDP-diacylglycerol--glycerol-3-phosphate 3-phosphatidyltransferase [Amphibacillus cookii]